MRPAGLYVKALYSNVKFMKDTLKSTKQTVDEKPISLDMTIGSFIFLGVGLISNLLS